MLEASFSALTRMEIIDPSSSGLQKNYLLAHQNQFYIYIYIYIPPRATINFHYHRAIISVLILINTDDHVNFVVIIFTKCALKTIDSISLTKWGYAKIKTKIKNK